MISRELTKLPAKLISRFICKGVEPGGLEEHMLDIIVFALRGCINQTPARMIPQCARQRRCVHAGATARMLQVLSAITLGIIATSTAGADPPQYSKSAGVSAAEAPAPSSKSAQCQEAEVNPVTGHVECIRPRGAAVDPPPLSAVPCTTNYAAGAKSGCPQLPPKDASSPTH
jgi:hypothetical protein